MKKYSNIKRLKRTDRCFGHAVIIVLTTLDYYARFITLLLIYKILIRFKT